jgi:peptidoglycan hydrolase-like protein with peptidoglycan-binding domain
MSTYSVKSTTANKLVTAVVGFAMAITFAFAGAVPASSGQTVDELQAQIAALLAQIQALQAQLDGGQTGGTVSHTFTSNLSMGARGADVRALQQVLNMSADTRVAASGPGSPGNETDYFGSLTRAAVIKFQEKHAAEILTPLGLTAGTGFVGASTRANIPATEECPLFMLSEVGRSSR